MKKYSVVIFGLLLMSLSAQAQEKNEAAPGRVHKVMQGETVMLISKKYLIKPEDIYKLNPEAVHGLQANTALILPPDSKLAEKKHAAVKVKSRRESSK